MFIKVHKLFFWQLQVHFHYTLGWCSVDPDLQVARQISNVANKNVGNCVRILYEHEILEMIRVNGAEYCDQILSGILVIVVSYQTVALRFLFLV